MIFFANIFDLKAYALKRTPLAPLVRNYFRLFLVEYISKDDAFKVVLQTLINKHIMVFILIRIARYSYESPC